MRTLEGTFALFQGSMQTTIIVNLFLVLVLGASMKRLWSLLNTLQILTHLPMLAFVFPTNLKVCLDIIRQVSNLNIIPKEWVTKFMTIIMSQVNSIVPAS